MLRSELRRSCIDKSLVCRRRRRPLQPCRMSCPFFLVFSRRLLWLRSLRWLRWLRWLLFLDELQWMVGVAGVKDLDALSLAHSTRALRHWTLQVTCDFYYGVCSSFLVPQHIDNLQGSKRYRM